VYAQEVLKRPNPLDDIARRFQGGAFVNHDYSRR